MLKNTLNSVTIHPSVISIPIYLQIIPTENIQGLQCEININKNVFSMCVITPGGPKQRTSAITLMYGLVLSKELYIHIIQHKIQYNIRQGNYLLCGGP